MNVSYTPLLHEILASRRVDVVLEEPGDCDQQAKNNGQQRVVRTFGPFALALLINAVLFLGLAGSFQGATPPPREQTDTIPIRIVVARVPAASEPDAHRSVEEPDGSIMAHPVRERSEPNQAETLAGLTDADQFLPRAIAANVDSVQHPAPTAPSDARTTTTLRSIVCSSSSENTREAADCSLEAAGTGLQFAEFAAADQIAKVADQTSLEASQIRALYGYDVDPYISTNPFSLLPTIMALPSPTHMAADEMRDRRAPVVPDPVFGD